ncbi:hypothetical protein N5079_19855 [Planotetraspora sp. A-T 1434]|uniref:hypothetical protein n=1 Tax=Planotetraspora sp. A-T 1434 TaxID=2979219 RepID=UPI0021BE1170|nr:hypothetical protein [Planotetraspora sp. A-T 1434]MCT9932460.1 hypothetical protein [Planotetraspora sp. A-T 1434]
MRRILALVAAALLAACMVGVGVAASAPSEPAKAYGGCVSRSTGYLRVLERGNLAKSTAGACKSTERKITWPSRSGVVFPSKLVFKRALATETCAKDAATSTSSAWVFSCTTVVVTPSPVPSPTPTPSASN